jgi:hypothetical protein
VIAGYQPIDQLISRIENQIPELKYSPNLRYLAQYRPIDNPNATLPSQRSGGVGGGIASLPAEFVAGSGSLGTNNPPPASAGETAQTAFGGSAAASTNRVHNIPVILNHANVVRHPPARAIIAQHPKPKPNNEKRTTPPKSAGNAEDMPSWCNIM